MSSEDMLTHNSNDQPVRPSGDTIGDAQIDLRRASPHISSYAEVDARRDVKTAFSATARQLEASTLSGQKSQEVVTPSVPLEIRLHARHVTQIRREYVEDNFDLTRDEPPTKSSNAVFRVPGGTDESAPSSSEQDAA